MHGQVIARAYELSSGWISRRKAVHEDSEAPCQHSEAALHRLLKGRGCYDGATAPNNLAPCCLPRISLPESLESAPDLIERVPPDALPFLQGDHERMLRSEADREAIANSGSLVTPYLDPMLRRNRRVLVRLVKRLLRIKLFRVTLRPRGRVGLFFVHKSKGGKIRLILDCRPSNQMFRPPPGTPLATVESLCSIEMEVAADEGITLFLGISDIDNCFHRLRLPVTLSDWFCLVPTFTARELGIVGEVINGITLGPDHVVSVASAMAPMGFSWSLYFAQRTSEHIFAASLGRDSTLFNDMSAPLVLDPRPEARHRSSHYVYVDNLGLLSFDDTLVRTKLSKTVTDFTQAGFELHEISAVTGEREALGTVLDCTGFHSRPTTKRFWNLRMAISGFLRRRRATGAVLEVLLGHATFAGLANRWTLSVFHLVYKFCRAHYYVAAPIWDGVRQELYAFRAS